MRGVEFIYAATPTPSIPMRQLPSNDWGFGLYGPAGGLEWWGYRPQLTPKRGYLWRSQRRKEGAPKAGEAILDSWSTPKLVGYV